MLNKDIPDIFEESVKQILYKIMNSCLVGRIVKIEDYDTSKVSVKPEITIEKNTGEKVEYPVITGVPLVIPGSEECSMIFPEKSILGSEVLLLFSQRSIDTWLVTGENRVPGDNKKFDISDCIAVFGLNSFNSNVSKISKDNDFEIRYGSGSIKIEESGTININNGNLTVDV